MLLVCPTDERVVVKAVTMSENDVIHIVGIGDFSPGFQTRYIYIVVYFAE